MPKVFPDNFEDFYKKHTHFPSFNLKDTAVIFSSQQLLRREYGEEIDSFSNVMRFNGAPTRGFEKYVGSKTTHRILGDRTRYREKDEKCFTVESNGSYFIKHLIRDFNSAQKPKNKEFFDHHFYINRQIQNLIYVYIVNQLKIPYANYSNGLIGLFYYLFSSPIPPVIFGFETQQERQKSSYYHYFDTIKNYEDDKSFVDGINRQLLKEYEDELNGRRKLPDKELVHNFAVEKKIVRILEQQKKVVIKQ